MPPLAGRRIAITADAVGGIWRYAIDVAASLARRDVAVTIIGLGPEPNAAGRAEAAAAGVPLAWLDGRLDWTLDGEGDAAALAADIADRAAAAGADILHLNAPALAGATEAELPTLVAAHSCLTTWWRAARTGPLPPAWDWHRRLTARGLRRAAVAVAPSAAFAAALTDAYGPLPTLCVIPNGARPIAPRPKREAVLAAGRWWDPAKNAATLDDAAALVDWPVLAAGPFTGPSGQAVTARHLHRLGALDHREMADATARAAIFVSLSVYEPFGLAVLEAATAGAALVLADIPTFRELWDGAALFVDPSNPADVARAMNGLIADQALRERLGAAARLRAKPLSLDRQADALIAAYGDASAARPLSVGTA